MRGLVLPTLAMLGIAITVFVWVRSERGWAPGATPQEAFGEVVARLFPRRVQTSRGLRRAAWRAVVNQVTIGVNGQGLVPSVVTVHLHPNDFALLDGMTDWVLRDMAEGLGKLAAEKDWAMPATPIVQFKNDSTRVEGRPLASSRFDVGTTVEPAETERLSGGGTVAQIVAMLVGTGDTATFLLDAPRLVIGRDRGVDLVVRDSAVSRRHAELVGRNGGWTVCDLGSANGTKVNGARVNGVQELNDGDQLALSSHTEFTFREA